MSIMRLFSNEAYKGTKHYLKTQKKYEIARTILYFAISLAVFLLGYITTKSRANLLSIVAVLGCLPASKSLVEAVMYCRFKGLSDSDLSEIEKHTDSLCCLYDCVFTSYQKNFEIMHMCICGNTVCGYSDISTFDESAFQKHIQEILKLDHHTDVTVKIFTDLHKYTERLEQLKTLSASEAKTAGIINTLKSVSL